MGNILTHDRIQMPASTGVLSKSGIVYGSNALQSITVGRHTPRDPVSAIGFLGIVDYHTGVITSDVALDCILVESSTKADISGLTNTAYVYGGKNMTIGTENYVLTGFSMNLQSGSPATVNFNLLTGTLASYLATQNAPAPLTAGEEAEFAVVMGDDGSGIWLNPTWQAGTTAIAGVIPYIDSTGALNTQADLGLPAGVQSLQFSASINRDQILDVRTTSAINFVTTYPIDVTMDMEMYCLPTASGVASPGASGYTGERSQFSHLLPKLQNLAVQSLAYGKHPSAQAPAGIASNNAAYVQARGLVLEDESEAIQVGRYLMYTFRFRAADMVLPLP